MSRFMGPGTAVYRCRMCGLTYDDVHVPKSSFTEALDAIMEVNPSMRPMDRDPRDRHPQAPRIMCTHDCPASSVGIQGPDRGVGIADLVGIRLDPAATGVKP